MGTGAVPEVHEAVLGVPDGVFRVELIAVEGEIAAGEGRAWSVRVRWGIRGAVGGGCGEERNDGKLGEEQHHRIRP